MRKPIAVFVLAVLASACSVNRNAYRFKPVPRGDLATPGAEIVAEDGSFRIVAGQPFTPPFDQGDRCLLEPSAENFQQGIASGAQPVVVKLADGRRLYGLVSFCGAPADARGPATRSYQVVVPEGTIADTSGGRVAVVFEPFTSSRLGAMAW